MPTLDMEGPYEFTRAGIFEEITRTLPGNYALGQINPKNGNFIVQYVGRSDTDVAGRLAQHLDEPYTHFKYSYATSPKAAFSKECQNYHDFGGSGSLNNIIHPRRPNNTNWKCPCCDIFGE